MKGVSYFKVAGVKLMTPPVHFYLCRRRHAWACPHVCLCMSDCGGAQAGIMRAVVSLDIM